MGIFCGFLRVFFACFGFFLFQSLEASENCPESLRDLSEVELREKIPDDKRFLSRASAPWDQKIDWARSESTKAIEVYWDEKTGFFSRRSRRGLMPSFNGQDPEDFLMLFAGYGSSRSHSGNLVTPLGAFTAKPSTKAGSLSTDIQGLRSFRPIGAEAFDLVGQGLGADPINFLNLDDVLHSLDKLVGERKKETGAKRIIPVARSASAGILLELVYRYPGTIDALILIGPLHPIVGFRESKINLLRNVLLWKDFQFDETGFDWVNRMHNQMTWHSQPEAFKDLPILLLKGSEDRELTEDSLKAFQVLLKNPVSRYQEIPGLGHDVLAIPRDPKTQASVLRSYEAIYTFLADF